MVLSHSEKQRMNVRFIPLDPKTSERGKPHCEICSSVMTMYYRIALNGNTNRLCKKCLNKFIYTCSNILDA